MESQLRKRLAFLFVVDSTTFGFSELLESGVSVYPNPFTHSFAVRVAGAEYGELRVRVTDLLGKEVKNIECRLTNEECRINASHLPKGIYILEIDGVGRTKIIKQ